MLKFFAAAAIAAAIGSSAAGARATTLTYDDIGVPGSVYPFLTQTGFVEQGYRFSDNMDVVDLSAGSPFASLGSAFSGKYAALNDFPGSAVITKVGGGPFNFESTHIRGINSLPTIKVTISGYNGATLVGSVDLTTSGAWQAITANLQGVTSVVIDPVDPENGRFFLDDTIVDSAVPEPGTWAMMLLGLGGLGIVTRARRSTEPDLGSLGV